MSRSALSVEGCPNVPEDKAYYKRYKICSFHSNLPVLEVGNTAVRWCQQCGRFQQLAEFEGDRKTCREKLDKHNSRRRTARMSARATEGDNFDTSSTNSQASNDSAPTHASPPGRRHPSRQRLSSGQAQQHQQRQQRQQRQRHPGALGQKRGWDSLDASGEEQDPRRTSRQAGPARFYEGLPGDLLQESTLWQQPQQLGQGWQGEREQQAGLRAATRQVPHSWGAVFRPQPCPAGVQPPALRQGQLGGMRAGPGGWADCSQVGPDATSQASLEQLLSTLLALPPSVALSAVSGLLSQPSSTGSSTGSSTACGPLELLQTMLAGLQGSSAANACMDPQLALLAAAAAGGQGLAGVQRPSIAPEPTTLPPWLSQLLSLAGPGSQLAQPALQQQKPASPAGAAASFAAGAPTLRQLQQLADQGHEGEEGALEPSAAWEKPPLTAAVASLPARQQVQGAAPALLPHSPLASGDASDQGAGSRVWAAEGAAEPSLPVQQQPERQQGQQQQGRGWQAWSARPQQSATFHVPDARLPASPRQKQRQGQQQQEEEEQEGQREQGREQGREQQEGEGEDQRHQQGGGNLMGSVERASFTGSQEHSEPASTTVQAAGRQTSQESQQAPAPAAQAFMARASRDLFGLPPEQLPPPIMEALARLEAAAANIAP